MPEQKYLGKNFIKFIKNKLKGEFIEPNYAVGVTDNSTINATKIQKIGNRVYINLFCKLNSLTNGWIHLFTLSQELKPEVNTNSICVRPGYGTFFQFNINENGEAYIYSDKTINDIVNLSGTISYLIKQN